MKKTKNIRVTAKVTVDGKPCNEAFDSLQSELPTLLANVNYKLETEVKDGKIRVYAVLPKTLVKTMRLEVDAIAKETN